MPPTVYPAFVLREAVNFAETRAARDSSFGFVMTKFLSDVTVSSLKYKTFGMRSAGSENPCSDFTHPITSVNNSSESRVDDQQSATTPSAKILSFARTLFPLFGVNSPSLKIKPLDSGS